MPPFNWHKYRKTPLGLRRKESKRKHWDRGRRENISGKCYLKSSQRTKKAKIVMVMIPRVITGGDNGVVMTACHVQGNGRSLQVDGLIFAQCHKLFNSEYAKNMLRMPRSFRCLISLGLPFPFFFPLHFSFLSLFFFSPLLSFPFLSIRFLPLLLCFCKFQSTQIQK